MSENSILEPGSCLRERYEIERLLGRGGFSKTYLATDLLMKVPVAVKEYDMDRVKSGDEAENEARIAAGFYNLKGIASARDYFTENGICYIVMEYVEGITITDYIAQNGRMNGREVLEKMRPVIYSLIRVHSKDVLHRDISADNLLISQDGSICLVDFGAARKTAENGNRPFTLIFKRGYAPVEQCRSKGRQGPWTDIYALCATMYFMITGVVPDDSVDRMIEDRVRPLSDMVGTGLSEEEARAVMKGMEVEAADRYDTALGLYQALYGEIPAGLGTAPPAEKSGIADRDRKRNRNVSGSRERRKSTTLLLEEVEHFYKEKNEKKRRWIPIGAAFVLVVAASVFAVVWTRGKASESITFPRDSSVSQTAISGQTASPAAEPPVETSGISKPVPISPAPVSVWRVGDYTGLEKNVAKKILKYERRQGLKLKIKEKYASKPKGVVLSQKPKAGTKLTELQGSVLTLVVSKGKRILPTSRPVQREKPDRAPGKKPEANPVRTSKSVKRKGDNVQFNGNLDDVING